MKRYSKITLKNIAESLGISISTVSRVLAGKSEKYRISTKTAERVRLEAQRTGFHPNQIASALRLKRTHTIGLIIPDISNPFFAAIARQVEMEAAKRGYFIILCDSRDSTDIEIEYIALLQARSVDGMIISPVGTSGEHLIALRNAGVPVVLVDRFFPDLPIPYVTSENRSGAFDAVTNLVNHGHRRIACVRGIFGSSTADERLHGYREALKQHGISFDAKLVAGDDFSYDSGYTATKKLFSTASSAPSALFSQGILITFGILKALEEMHISIPEDVSIISFDDHYYTAFLSTPLTTVAQNKESIGEHAVKLLFRQFNRGVDKVTEGVLIPTTLVERNSVGTLQKTLKKFGRDKPSVSKRNRCQNKNKITNERV